MNYVVTADVYNVVGYHGIDYGFPGIAYNIENNQNFDFVYLRYDGVISIYFWEFEFATWSFWDSRILVLVTYPVKFLKSKYFDLAINLS